MAPAARRLGFRRAVALADYATGRLEDERCQRADHQDPVGAVLEGPQVASALVRAAQVEPRPPARSYPRSGTQVSKCVTECITTAISWL